MTAANVDRAGKARFMVVPAAYVAMFRNGPTGPEVLLQLRNGAGYMDGYWETPAGHIEEGETPAEAAIREVREVREELDVGILEAKLEPLTAMYRTGDGGLPTDNRVDFFFACKTWAGTLRRVEPDKSAALFWYPLWSLPTPVIPHELYVLQGIITGALPQFSSFASEVVAA